jgi:sugar/nucleoside kinase (ribokinase family)
MVARPCVVHPEPLVGAGDAFAAALVLSLAAGQPLDAALQAACDAGASV